MDNKKYDVFLSYNSRDKDIAEKLASILRDKQKLKVWFDRWELVPGTPWMESLENALDSSRTVLVFIGKQGLGRWAAEEFNLALSRQINEGVRIIPVLGPGGDINQIPLFLQATTFIDLREWSEESFNLLFTVIKGTPPSRVSGKRSPKVFLCHAHEDSTRIEELYFLLQDEGLNPWFDKKNLIVGDKWEDEIISAIENSDFFAIFLSNISVNKTGFIQKEIRTAVKEFQNKPQGIAYLLPVRLEDCQVPKIKLDFNTFLPDLQWIDVYEKDYSAVKKLAQGIWKQWDKFTSA